MTGIRKTPRAAFLAAAVLLFCAFTGGRLEAGPEDETGKKAAPKPGPKGQAFKDDRLGVSAQAPSGWKLVVNKAGAPTSWVLLATFNDKDTDAQATLSVRPRSAATVEQLMTMVRKTWQQSRDRLRLDAIRPIQASTMEPIARVMVDGSFTREAPKQKPTKDGVEPPPQPDVNYRVQATYMLGPGHEYLLYAQGQKTHWSRLREPLRQLAGSIRFKQEESVGPKGAGSFRDDQYGFACVFPQDYTVVTPQRRTHIVEFQGLSPEAAVLSVYAFPFSQGADKDAERLVTYYEQDKGGTATFQTGEVSGQEAVLLKAKAQVGGVDRVVLIAILKRGDTVFRLRASMPAKAEAAGTSAFNKFKDGFRLLSAPK